MPPLLVFCSLLQIAKLKCILHYFEKIAEDPGGPVGKIIIKRQVCTTSSLVPIFRLTDGDACPPFSAWYSLTGDPNIPDTITGRLVVMWFASVSTGCCLRKRNWKCWLQVHPGEKCWHCLSQSLLFIRFYLRSCKHEDHPFTNSRASFLKVNFADEAIGGAVLEKGYGQVRWRSCSLYFRHPVQLYMPIYSEGLLFVTFLNEGSWIFLCEEVLIWVLGLALSCWQIHEDGRGLKWSSWASL